MPIQPLQDLINSARSSVRNERPNSISTSSGDGTRHNQMPVERAAVSRRQLIRWFVPETGIVDMYINPENIVYNNKKVIQKQRTKGGFTLQYWGEDLGQITLNGTTGSSGIEGINVLYDIYRAEHLAFDPYAIALAEQAQIEQNNMSIFGDNILSDIGGTLINQVSNALESGSVNPSRPRPTLASLAFSVEMYWSGWIFRGFFEDFRVTESAQKIGIFEYSTNFTVTQRRGYRSNFFAWHRSPVHGPSNSDPNFGVPYSYGELIEEQGTISGRQSEEPIISLNDRLISSKGYVGNDF